MRPGVPGEDRVSIGEQDRRSGQLEGPSRGVGIARGEQPGGGGGDGHLPPGTDVVHADRRTAHGAPDAYAGFVAGEDR